MLHLGRYWQTARHLKPGQLGWWIYRRAAGRSYRLAEPSGAALGEAVALRPGVALRAPIAPQGLVAGAAAGLEAVGREAGGRAAGGDRVDFTFLNRSLGFAGAIDWRAAEMPKLWRYNLHYFDYALDPACAAPWLAATMADWIRRNPPGAPDAWEPYPVSLRIVNWVKFALAQGGAAASGEWRRSLHRQAAWLAGNLEYEIQANHLLKNAKALLFAGAFLDGAAADRWLQAGARLLAAGIREQILADGGHYERSPMYHAIVLEDLLDCLNLLRSSAGLEAAGLADLGELEAGLEAAARRALGWLAAMTLPDGEIALFNDAALGIAPSPAALVAYARRLFDVAPGEAGELGEAGEVGEVGEAGASLIALPGSGYFGYRRGGEQLIVDAGPIGPDHQPGHGHCDLLSFELALEGRRVIVDAGVFGYEADALRRQIRGTAAHNTLMVDGAEQSDIWGSFRVGRRARPLAPAAALSPAGHFSFEAGHDGFRHLPGKPVHRRRMICEIGRRWTIADTVAGAGEHRVASYLHFHPDFALREEAGSWIAARAGETPLLRITPSGGTARRIDSVYCPRFGVKLSNAMLCLEAAGRLPLELGYTIEKI